MIQSSGRFSGGGSSGGSNRTVVFTASVDTKDARRELGALAKDVDRVQKQMSGMRVGSGGGSGRPGATLTGVPTAAQDFLSIDRQQDRWFREQRRREQQQATVLERERARNARQSELAMARDSRAFRGEIKDTMEGVIGLTRAMVLFGVTSEESMQKALRGIIAFEAAVAGYKGGVKLAGGLGGLLGRGAGALGIAAGAGGMTLGAAGIGAGIGIIGAGAAIRDQINYSRTGQIGEYSRGVAGFYTGFTRKAYSLGFTTEGLLANSGTPYGRLAASDIAYERSVGGMLPGAFSRAQYSAGQLGDAQYRLSFMERAMQGQQAADARRMSGVMGYAALSPWDQHGMDRLRKKFLENPNSVGDRGLLALQPYVGKREQNQIQDIISGRHRGFTSRGFAAEDEMDAYAKQHGVTMDAVKTQRELVMKFEVANTEAVESLKNIIDRAIEAGNDDLKKKVEALEAEYQNNIRQQNQNSQQRAAAQVSGFGGATY